MNRRSRLENEALASAPPAGVTHDAPNIGSRLITLVDSVPETQGSGVVLIDFGRLNRLRPANMGAASVVFERRVRPPSIPFLLARQPQLAVQSHHAEPSRNTSKARNAHTSPATEWINLGFNCGGAVLAWVGVAGMSALAPVTGGVSGFGAVLLYGGAAASTGQCVVSAVRINNLQRGRASINDKWDDSPVFVYTMLAADGISLIGAGGALRELKMTNAALRDAGFSLKRAGSDETISRPMRRRLTTALELQGAARVSGVEINRVVRRRLIDGAGGILGLFASGFSGVLKESGSRAWDLVIWITDETGQTQ